MILGIEEKTTVIQWGIVIGASLVAAVFDARQNRIPNALTIPFLLFGVTSVIIFGGVSGFAQSVGACILLALPFVLLFIFANGGAGDAKLMGAIGAWIGLEQGVRVLLCVVIAGIIMALAKAIMNGCLKRVLANIYASVYTFMCFALSRKSMQYSMIQKNTAEQKHRDMTVSYGVAIFAGVCIAASTILL